MIKRNIPVTRTSLPDIEEYVSIITEAWDNRILSNNGDLSHRLTSQLTSYLDNSGVQLCSSGTLALQVLIRSMELSGEIITTPFSYVSTSSSILWESCRPIFVDIEENYWCIDPKKIRATITEETSAILATHIFGIPADIEELEKLGKEYQ